MPKKPAEVIHQAAVVVDDVIDAAEPVAEAIAPPVAVVLEAVDKVVEAVEEATAQVDQAPAAVPVEVKALPSLLDQALADPQTAHACWLAIEEGRILVAKAWEFLGHGHGVHVRRDVKGNEIAVVAHTDHKGDIPVFEAKVGAQRAPQDLPLAEAKAWVDGVLKARAAYLLG